jgi:uncharacterized protein YprB with RNaseH-like and TPR domain
MRPLSTRIKRFQPLVKPATAESASGVKADDGLFKSWNRKGRHTLHLSVRLEVRLPDPKGLEQLRKAFGFSHSLEDMIFYDTETTGLSAGAGSLAFLAGFGRFEEGAFVIDQYFLSDFPGEREFLGHVAGRLDPRKLYVSYNGKAFDRHLLKSRFLMNGMKIDLPEHFDLLFPSRSLWRSVVGSCSLSSLETSVLGVRRTIDIPGEEIPDVYFQYLRTGEGTRMGAVVEHHRQDILTLVLLLSRLAEIFADPSGVSGVDRARLSRFLRRIDPAVAERFCRRCFAEGDRSCGVVLATEYKKARGWDEAAAIWESLDAIGGDFYAAIELAKYHEHRTRDLKKARTYVEKCLSLAEAGIPAVKASLLHRKERLEKKEHLKSAAPDGLSKKRKKPAKSGR